MASATIRNFSIEKLPLVILVAKLKGNMEIIQVSQIEISCLRPYTYIMKVIHGNVILDEFMTALLSAGGSIILSTHFQTLSKTTIFRGDLPEPVVG